MRERKMKEGELGGLEALQSLSAEELKALGVHGFEINSELINLDELLLDEFLLDDAEYESFLMTFLMTFDAVLLDDFAVIEHIELLLS